MMQLKEPLQGFSTYCFVERGGGRVTNCNIYHSLRTPERNCAQGSEDET